jgi:hypothetical protein
MARPRPFLAVILTLLVIAGALGVCWLYHGVAASLEAEGTLQAYMVVLDVLRVYMAENPGKWPKSWEDIKGIQPGNPGGMFRWPADITEYRKRVRINFTLTRADVAAMSVDNFSAVQQTYPNHGPREGMIQALLEESRK